MFGYTHELHGFQIVATRELWGQYAWFVADKQLTGERSASERRWPLSSE